jgi:lysophospholipase L1-like esterase
MIQTVANDFGFTFIDIHPLLLSGEELDRSMSGDGIHLNALGYEIVASELVKNISELRNKD